MAAASAAVVSVLAAATCCLPVGTILAAAGTAGASAMLERARGWLMPLSLVLLTVAFLQTYWRREAHRPLGGQILLWLSAAIVLGVFFFPQWVAVMVADMTGGR